MEGYHGLEGKLRRLPSRARVVSPTVLVNGEPAGSMEFDNARVIAEQAARWPHFADRDRNSRRFAKI